MSSVSSAAPTATGSSSCAGQAFSDFPTKDVACAVGGTQGVPSNYSDILKDCCNSAPVESWNNGCALWCLSVDQSVSDLQKCWQEGGVNAALIFCSGNQTATATGKPDSSSNPTASGTQATGTAAQSTGAAPVVLAPQGVSKAGLGMLAMIVVSAAFGALL